MKVSMLVLLAVMMTGCDSMKSGETRSRECDIEKLKVQAESDKARSGLEIETRKAFLALQIKVIEACVAKGLVPALMGGNITCNKPQ